MSINQVWNDELATGNEKFLCSNIGILYDQIKRLDTRLDLQNRALQTLTDIINSQQKQINKNQTALKDICILIRKLNERILD